VAVEALVAERAFAVVNAQNLFLCDKHTISRERVALAIDVLARAAIAEAAERNEILLALMASAEEAIASVAQIAILVHLLASRHHAEIAIELVSARALLVRIGRVFVVELDRLSSLALRRRA